MQLEQGVRFELRLTADTSEGAVFAIELRVPAAEWVGEATISVGSGAVTMTFAAEEQPPAWCTQAVRAALRSLFRDHVAGKRYPARVTRWRAAPSAEDAE
jgi:hypothetical protein